MSLFSIITTLTILTLAVQAQTLDLAKYETLTVEQKVEFFGGQSKMRLQPETDLVQALVLGVADSDEAVRRRATQRAAMTLAGLQQLAQSGQPVPVHPTELAELSRVLTALLTSADGETRAAAVRGVVASASPTDEMEAVLLKTLEAESNDELRAGLLEAMRSAGYQSDTFKRVLMARLDQAKEKELEALFAACAALRIKEALPALIARIDQPGVPQVILLRSIADFGIAASGAKAKLERLMADPSSTHQAEARTALAALTQEAPRRMEPRPFVDLVPQPSSSKGQAARPSAEVAVAGKTTSFVSETQETKPSTLGEQPTSSSLWFVVTLVTAAALGLVWLLLKRRKK